eukprot:TRINITY_DN14436_c0_g1_i1.p1 TRINITY_DN14436_c0_g1~~TRINITY_DN14436_c0_g1_i1.p1  ORF type:complete len:617 (+),score=158.37 TRINITY_DN14436_c0_g1_i1:88-1851(+)
MRRPRRPRRCPRRRGLCTAEVLPTPIGLWNRAVAAHASRPCVFTSAAPASATPQRWGARALTFAEVEARSNSAARALRDRWQVGAGSRVLASCAPPGELAVLLVAALKLGATLCAVPLRRTAEGLHRAEQRCQPALSVLSFAPPGVDAEHGAAQRVGAGQLRELAECQPTDSLGEEEGAAGEAAVLFADGTLWGATELASAAAAAAPSGGSFLAAAERSVVLLPQAPAMGVLPAAAALATWAAGGCVAAPDAPQPALLAGLLRSAPFTDVLLPAPAAAALPPGLGPVRTLLLGGAPPAAAHAAAAAGAFPGAAVVGLIGTPQTAVGATHRYAPAALSPERPSPPPGAAPDLWHLAAGAEGRVDGGGPLGELLLRRSDGGGADDSGEAAARGDDAGGGWWRTGVLAAHTRGDTGNGGTAAWVIDRSQALRRDASDTPEGQLVCAAMRAHPWIEEAGVDVLGVTLPDGGTAEARVAWGRLLPGAPRRAAGAGALRAHCAAALGPARWAALPQCFELRPAREAPRPPAQPPALRTPGGEGWSDEEYEGLPLSDSELPARSDGMRPHKTRSWKNVAKGMSHRKHNWVKRHK